MVLKRFTGGYAEEAVPLYGMLKKRSAQEWDFEQAAVVKELKEALMQAPVLAYPQVGKSFRLQRMV